MHNMLQDFSALVTGGTRGIGNKIAHKLRDYGAKVTVTGKSDTKQHNLNFDYICVDFSNPTQVAIFCEKIKNLHFDIVINNAGINIVNNFYDIKYYDFQEIMQINVNAAFQITQAALPYMINKRWGRIINIASIWSKISKTGRASYSASKFALVGMTTALAAEVASKGILVNCVSPGFIMTDLTLKILGEKGIAEMEKCIPIGRLGQPEEIAELVAWLASAKNSYISGQNIVADGGFTNV